MRTCVLPRRSFDDDRVEQANRCEAHGGVHPVGGRRRGGRPTSAAWHHGGTHLIPSATSLALVNVTITDDESGNFGGGLGIGGAAVPVTMVNTIVAKNRVRGVAAHHDCSGTVTSEGYNLIGVSTGCTMGGDLTGVLLDENPRLFPPADNGGPTLTHALRPASPAIDSGDTASGPAFDQRSVARPHAKRPRLPAISDMGAFGFVR